MLRNLDSGATLVNGRNVIHQWPASRILPRHVCKLHQPDCPTHSKSCCISIPARPTEEMSPGLMHPDPQHRNTPNVLRCAPRHRLHRDASPKVKEVVANRAPEQTPPSTIPRHCWRLSVREAFVRSVCQPHHREPLANGLHCFWTWPSFKRLFLWKTANVPVPDEQEHVTCTLSFSKGLKNNGMQNPQSSPPKIEFGNTSKLLEKKIPRWASKQEEYV